MKHFLSCLLILSASLFLRPHVAMASPELRKAANVMVMAEALLAETSLLSERFGENIEELVWSASFSERQWVVNISSVVNGQEANMTMTGYAWGDDDETIAINYSGLGRVGAEPVLMHGQAVWLYDPEAQDYQSMDFHHVTRIGENSIWGWVLGAEIIVGSLGGSALAVGTSAAATGGLALGAAPWIAAGGAAKGAAGLVTFSAAASVLLEADEAPEPPPTPTRPSLPRSNEELLPERGNIIVALSGDGQLTGSASDGTHFLNGSYNWNEGSANGSISSQ
ncbi:hypothetical protein [Roseobacter sp. MH60115]|uniref:hypothetical protein n=1 Tax=Roseobacter sp. MH60115 TaxID=2785324 RepID=UPI0018A2EE26|nr:hypothetical protein [Roseobacter sp. MH60115]